MWNIEELPTTFMRNEKMTPITRSLLPQAQEDERGCRGQGPRESLAHRSWPCPDHTGTEGPAASGPWLVPEERRRGLTTLAASWQPSQAQTHILQTWQSLLTQPLQNSPQVHLCIWWTSQQNHTRVLLKLEGFSDVSRKLKAKDGPNLLQQRIIIQKRLTSNMKLYYYSKQLKQESDEARVDIERKIKSPEIELKITEFQGMETADLMNRQENATCKHSDIEKVQPAPQSIFQNKLRCVKEFNRKKRKSWNLA